MSQRGFLALLLIAGATRPADGQDRDVVLEVDSFELSDASAADRYIRFGIRSDLPEGASITFKMAFEGEPIPMLWMGAYLDAEGRGMVEVGPLQQKLLPGLYQVILVVDPLEQDPERAEYWSKFSGPFERVVAQRIGVEAEETALRAETKQKILEQVLAIEKATAEVREVENDLKTRTGRFFEQGVLRREEFVAWGDRLLGVLTEIDRFCRAVPAEFYVVYYAAAYKYLLPGVWLNARYAFIDYTVYPVLERERKALEAKGEAYLLPERFRPLEGGSIRPPRDGAFELAARDAQEVRQLIGEAPAPPELDGLLPSVEDLPAGFEIGSSVPTDLGDLLDRNPAPRATLSASDVRALDRIVGGFALPPRAPIAGLFYCLTPVPPAPGESPADPAQRVLVVLLQFPDASMARIPIMEIARTDRKKEVEWTILASEGTIAIVLPAPGDASTAAAAAIVDWYSREHGLRVAARGAGE